jgi:hypothetical protein
LEVDVAQLKDTVGAMAVPLTCVEREELDMNHIVHQSLKFVSLLLVVLHLSETQVSCPPPNAKELEEQ